MMSAVQNAKRNDLKSTLKFVFIALTLAGVLLGTALGGVLVTSFDGWSGLLQSPALFSLIFACIFLVATVWHYTKKIDLL
jgi:hypothetical protein